MRLVYVPRRQTPWSLHMAEDMAHRLARGRALPAALQAQHHARLVVAPQARRQRRARRQRLPRKPELRGCRVQRLPALLRSGGCSPSRFPSRFSWVHQHVHNDDATGAVCLVASLSPQLISISVCMPACVHRYVCQSWHPSSAGHAAPGDPETAQVLSGPPGSPHLS